MAGTVLVTGGAGYIGSHACVSLIEAGYEVLVLDNLCNSSQVSLERVQQICGVSPLFVGGDVRDARCLDQLFQSHDIVAVLRWLERDALDGCRGAGDGRERPNEYFLLTEDGVDHDAGRSSADGHFDHGGVGRLMFTE